VILRVLRWIVPAALVVLIGAAVFFAERHWGQNRRRPVPPGFVTTQNNRFIVDGKPFRFVGANAAIFYGREADEMPQRMQAIAADGVRVVRVWASGESGPDDAPGKGISRNDWVGQNPFRRGPNDWNEGAFVQLDRIIAEAESHHLYVQLCLLNWWRDNGGVLRYLDWAGIKDARDDGKEFGINLERAMQFYSNATARELYREHVRRIVTRRNSITGRLYADDPTILGYELMNEAQALNGRWGERKAWMAEMSTYVRSLDAHHLISPGTWGYRTGGERRAWIEEHRLPNIDYCDVHHYPRDDTDSFVDTPEALGAFLDNRVAAALEVDKPLVVSEFGVPNDGYHGLSRTDWYRAYFDNAVRAGVAGAMCWIYTFEPEREYSITQTSRDESIHAEIKRGAALMAEHAGDWPPLHILELEHHRIPHQFAFSRPPNDPATEPFIVWRTNGILYQFRPENVAAGRFEQFGGGFGYVWGLGMGYFEYDVPRRNTWRRVGQIVVRANLVPVNPHDLLGQPIETSVTLFINGIDCGSKLVPTPAEGQASIQRWTVDKWNVRWQAVRAQPLRVRFEVTTTADQPFGINISNFPAGFDAKGATPVEVEVN
jgi:mannan endo-1,4-beta-mannosidase